MNEILQKRIESAANHYLLHEHKSPLNEILHQCDLKTEMQYHKDIEQAYIEGGKNSLQNQWISVDEALPEKRQYVLVAVLDTKSNTYFWGFDNIDGDNGEFLRDKNGFAIENDSHKITHWMEIPSLKGDEK